MRVNARPGICEGCSPFASCNVFGLYCQNGMGADAAGRRRGETSGREVTVMCL